MAVHTQFCFLLFGTCLVSFLLLFECRKLEGYAFPVFSTQECPRNQAEWNNRSSAINCTKSNGYMCMPNENFTDLLEFCYIYPRILVQNDLCLYLVQRFSRINSYNCRNFTHGCPELSYFSSETYIHPSCMEIENGCFSAEPSCERQPLRTENSVDDTEVAIILGSSIPICFLCILVIYMIRKKFGIYKRRSNVGRDQDICPLLPFPEGALHDKLINYKEPFIEKDTFDQWEKDDSFFISTKACEEVKKLIESKNLVIVAGHSGSGKSAIIQHIALDYKKKGWTVKRVTKVEDIVNYKPSSPVAEKKTIFVFNDPFGKESCDEILINLWKIYAKNVEDSLKTAKLLMSCRNFIISNTRVTRYPLNQSDIVDIDNEKYKLSVDEKRQILTKYSKLGMELSEKDRDKIIKVEKYFLLLCKLYSGIDDCKNKGIEFFTQPVTVLKEEIIGFRKNNKSKYCGLALLVLSNNDLCVSDFKENKDTEIKFKHTLKLCGLPENIQPPAIWENLNLLKGFLVSKVGDKYHFYHDLVMEITTHVFGTTYPDEIIKYADIRLLRKRVRLWDCEELTDPFTLYLSEKYIEKLGERFLNELIGNRFMDVVLNPCMKGKRMIEVLKKIIQKNPEKLQLLFEKKQHKLEMPSIFLREPKQLYVSKLVFIGLENNITPLSALIVFSHTDFSLECLNTLPQIQANSINRSLLPAVYCNGSMKLFHIFFKDRVKESLNNKWGNTYGNFLPIHIVSAYHNYEILEELIKIEVKITSKTEALDIITPLLLAVGNDTQGYGDYDHEESGATRRDKTVQLLLSDGANINFSNRKGTSPLHIACIMGYNSTVKLLLNNQADINSTTEKGASPLFKACKKGNESTVQLLLSNGAKINLCTEKGASPLHIACHNGHDSTVQLLLSNRAEINLPMEDGASPLYEACDNGHDSTVQLLLNNGADINLYTKDGTSPFYIACQNGHDSTVQLLMNNGADINLSTKKGASPLHIACHYGHKSTVQLLLSNGADINLCTKEGASPLYEACDNGHDSTVQLLLSNGAEINLCTKDGASPLYIACQNGHDSTVQLLLSNGADINLCTKEGASPLYIACQNGHNSTKQLLLSNGADINLCEQNKVSPLFIAS